MAGDHQGEGAPEPVLDGAGLRVAIVAARWNSHVTLRLLREVGEGKLHVTERLRRGDELQYLFETFEEMVHKLRTRREGEKDQGRLL